MYEDCRETIFIHPSGFLYLYIGLGKVILLFAMSFHVAVTLWCFLKFSRGNIAMPVRINADIDTLMHSTGSEIDLTLITLCTTNYAM